MMMNDKVIVSTDQIPRRREYQTYFNGGSATVVWSYTPQDFGNNEIDDLLDWIELITRQIRRMKPEQEDG